MRSVILETAAALDDKLAQNDVWRELGAAYFAVAEVRGSARRRSRNSPIARRLRSGGIVLVWHGAEALGPVRGSEGNVRPSIEAVQHHAIASSRAGPRLGYTRKIRVVAWTADFNPRGASARLWSGKIETLRGLKPAVLHFTPSAQTVETGFIWRVSQRISENPAFFIASANPRPAWYAWSSVAPLLRG